MLFNAVAMNCTISNFLKILSIMQSVHYWNYYEKSRRSCIISDESDGCSTLDHEKKDGGTYIVPECIAGITYNIAEKMLQEA